MAGKFLAEVSVTVLPILPIERGVINGASIRTEIIDIERLLDGDNFALRKRKIVDDKFRILGKIQALVEIQVVRFYDTGAIKFIDGRIETTVGDEKAKMVMIIRLVRFFRRKWIYKNVAG